MELLNECPRLPANALRVTSRPGKAAHQFLQNNLGVELYLAEKQQPVYFVTKGDRVWRLRFDGTPSQLVTNSNFNKFYKQYLSN